MADHTAKQPEPVKTRAYIVTAIGTLSALVVHWHGGVYSTWLDEHKDEIATAILVAGPTVSAWLARKHVTPVVSPKSADGESLAVTPVKVPAVAIDSTTLYVSPAPDAT